MPSTFFSRLATLFRSSPPGPRAKSGFMWGLRGYGGFAGPSNTSGINVNESTALALPALFSGVQTIASDLAALPLELIQTMPDGSTRKAVEHRCWPIFSRSPDGISTPMRWRSSMIAHSILWGNSYAEVVPSVDGDRVYLFLLSPDATQARWTATGDVEYVTSGGVIAKERVVHLALLGHDGVSGHPLARLARQAIGLGLAAEQYGGAFLNGASASMMFKPPVELKKDAKQTFLDEFTVAHGGPDNAGKAAILPAGWSVEQMDGSDPQQAQLLDLRRFSVLDVARLLNLPPHKLGDKSGESYASIEASNLEYVQGTLLSRAVAFEQALNLRLLADDEVRAGYTFRHDFRALLRADATGRANIIKTMFASKAITPNEIRIGEGYQPIDSPDMNQTYMQLNQGTGDQALLPDPSQNKGPAK